MKMRSLSARYVKFDVRSFCQVAADKVLLLTMNDGKEVTTRIPNLNVGRASFVASSEVATMDFVSTPPITSGPLSRLIIWFRSGIACIYRRPRKNCSQRSSGMSRKCT